VILEESKHRLKRFKSFVVDELSRQARGLESPRELLDSVLFRVADALASPESLSVEIKRSREETERYLKELADAGRARLLGPGRWIHTERLVSALARVDAALADWFREHAHRQVVDVRDLRRATELDAALLDALLAEAQRRGKLVCEAGGLVRPAGRSTDLDAATADRAKKLEAALAAARFQPPSIDELAKALALSAKEVKSLIEHLVDAGRVERVATDLYLARANYDAARAAIVGNCGRHGALDIPSLRDELGTTRKFLIPLLEHFDAQGLTMRQGAHRVLKKR